MDGVCREFKEKLILYHYGELTVAEAREMEEHLAGCASCASAFEELARDLKGLPVSLPVQSDVNKAVAGVLERITVKRRRALRLVPAFAVAAAIILGVLFTMHIPMLVHKEPVQQQMVLAQGDYYVLENMDVLGDLDVIENMDNVAGVEEEM